MFSCPSGTTLVVDEKGQTSCTLEEGVSIVAFTQQPSQTTPIGLNQDVIIKVRVTYPSSISQIKTINWKQTDIYASRTKLLQGITFLNTAVLIIPKRNLVANTKYELTVEVLLEGAVATSATTSFTTVKSIIGGTFNISPTSGSFYDTTFNLTLRGWDQNIANGLALTFTIIAYRNENSNKKVIIANGLDLLSSLSSSNSSSEGYQFTIPSLFESQNEKDVVYRIELLADSSSDLLTVSKTIILQPLSSERVAELIANTDPATITEPAAMSNFVVLTAQNLIQSNELETETTKAMLTAFQVYQTFTGDYSVTCIASIHCSGYGKCIDTIGTTSSTGPQCTCEEGWSGSACNKDSQQLQQAQKQLEAVLPKLLNTTPTIRTVGSQLLAVQIATKELDLIPANSSVPSLMSQTVISSYKVVSMTSSTETSPSSSREILSSLADAAFSLISQFSSLLDSNSDINSLLQIFTGSLQEILAGLSLGESNEIDADSLCAFLTAVDDLFEEIVEGDESDGNQRILQGFDGNIHQQNPPRQPPRILSSSVTTSTPQIFLMTKSKLFSKLKLLLRLHFNQQQRSTFQS